MGADFGRLDAESLLEALAAFALKLPPELDGKLRALAESPLPVSQKETPPISLVSERLLIAYAEAVIEANQRGGDGSSEDAELNLRRRISMLENFGCESPPAVPPPEMATTGPSAWLRKICVRFDRLFSLDHNPARKASDEYDEAFHDAVHALKDLRQFASIIAPTWTAASRVSQSAPPPEIVEALETPTRSTTMDEIPEELTKALNQFARWAGEMEVCECFRNDCRHEKAARAARSKLEQLFRELLEEIEKWKGIAHDLSNQSRDRYVELESLKKEQLTPDQLRRVMGSLAHDNGCVFTTSVCTCGLAPIFEKLRTQLCSGHTSTRGKE